MSQNIKPSVWGPHGWKFMHYVSLGYPTEPTTEDKNNYKQFYESLQYILPCGTCANNYTKNIREFPIDKSLETRDSLVKWVIDIHNSVNKETGKKLYDYDQGLKLYITQQNPLFDHGFKLLILLIILIGVYWIMK